MDTKNYISTEIQILKILTLISINGEGFVIIKVSVALKTTEVWVGEKAWARVPPTPSKG